MKLFNDVIQLLRESKKQLNSNFSRPSFRSRVPVAIRDNSATSATDLDESSPPRRFAASARMSLLSHQEIPLFSQLRQAFDESIFVWPKPRLSDVLALRSSESYAAAFELQNKQLGFLLCRQADMSPLLAIRFGSEDEAEPNDEALNNIGLTTVRFNSPTDFSVSRVQSELAKITDCVNS